MKKPTGKAVALAVAIGLLMLVAVSLVGLGAPSGTKGPPDGDHGRKKDSTEQGLLLGLIFGDQWVIVRDLSAEENGKPIYFSWTWPEEAYTADGDFDPSPGVYPTGYLDGLEEGCVQPVSFDPVTPLDRQFEVSDSSARFYDSYGRNRVPTYLIPLDPECKIPDVYAATWGEQVMEADSGRLNLARSPQNVIDAAYEEAIATMNRALSFSLDPAGRLVLELETTDEYGDLQTYLKTIDSPLENLALYQRVLQNGCLAATDTISLSEGSAALLTRDGMGYLVCGDDPLPNGEDFPRAAAFLGGACDKTGRVTVDMLIYLNNRLEVNEVVWSENKQDVTIGYYNFQGATYQRGASHLATTADVLEPGETPDPPGYPGYFRVARGTPIFSKIFTDDWPESGGNPVNLVTPIISFVRAADDALVIINYIHNYELPTYPMPPIQEPIYPDGPL